MKLRRMALGASIALLLAGSLAGSPAPAAPVGDALSRPALRVRQPARGVLLGVARAGERLVAVGERGLIVVSDDSGAHWRQVSVPVAVTLTAVRFADASHGVAVGHGGTVLTTRDGGLSWTARLDGRRLAQLALESARASGDAARLKEAERLVADGPDKPLLDVAIWDARRMLVVGAYGLALQTHDGGASWQPVMERLPNPKALHLYVLRRLGDTLLVAGEQGLLLRSDDGGASFRPLASPYRGSWFSGELMPSGEWLLGGLRGNAWRSGDGGSSWSQLELPMPASVTGMAIASDGALLLSTQSGHLLRRDGERLRPVGRDALPPLAGVAVASNGGLLAIGLSGVTPVSPAR